MALSQWDRDYIEHLLQKELRAEANRKAVEAEDAREQFMGQDRYYWDIHAWPKHPQIRSHHQVMVIRCPECHTRLDLSLVAASWPPQYYQHSPGCEFFRAEQRQWVDDYADLRNDLQPGTRHHGYSRKPLLRSPTATERALLQILTHGRKVGTYYMISVSVRDYQLVRTPIEIPTP